MPNVSNYWPGNFWQAMNQSLAWLYGRQSSPAGNWLGDALLTQGATCSAVTEEPGGGLVECGLSSQINFLTGLTVSGAQEAPFAMSQVESIAVALPPGLWVDNQLGPDGYPVNESGQALPWGNLLVNGYQVTSAMQQSVGALLYNANSSQITPGLPQTAGVIAKWTPNANYPFGALIVDSNNNVQMALYNGATASTGNPPNWPTQLGALTGDNTQLWKLIALGYQNTYWVATGYVFNLLNAQSSYRVDVFVHSDVWYYQGSCALQTMVPPGGGTYAGGYTWSLAGVRAGLLMAALYPAGVAPPASGWYGPAIPSGWVAHTNTGVCQMPQDATTLGGKLASYKAQIYVKTDVEYLLEDNIPIIVQSDGFHARAGSSVIFSPGSGTPAIHILYNDPIVGWTEIFDSIESELEYSDLPRSFDVPTSDPLYVPNPGATDIPALQNRGYIYDSALAILAYTSAGNFTAAEKVINQLNAFLAAPGYLASTVLENAEDGSIARWSSTPVTLSSASATWSETDGYEDMASAIAAFAASGTPALVGHAEAGNATCATTTASNTTGANLLVAWVAVEGANPTAPTDYFGNTWQPLPAYSNGAHTHGKFFYVYNPSVGLGHTFTATGAYVAIAVSAWSGMVATPTVYLTSTGATNSFTYSLATGALSYSGAVLLVTGWASDNNHSMNLAVDSGFTVLGSLTNGAASEILSHAYLVPAVTASGLTVANVSASSTNPPEPPYGSGRVLDFHSGCANTVSTYLGSSLPDTTDTYLSFEHMEAAGAGFVFDVGVVTAQGLVTDIQVTSGAAGPATLSGTVITVPIGPGETLWRTTLLDLKSQISNLTGDAIVKITGFKLTLTAANTDVYFDNLSVGTLQPANSLSFSYDTYNGQVDQAYIRAGSMAWVVYAYCVYMRLSQDFSPALALQGMINFLLTLQSAAADLTHGLFYEGYGRYQNPGYQFIPGLVPTVSTEHQIDLWFAFQRAANALPVAATNLAKIGAITSAQSSSLVATAGAATAAAASIDTNLMANLYIPPSGSTPGHFAQGATGSTLDTSQALDASGHWAALWAHATSRDDIALQCAKFAYTTFLVTNQTVALSNQSNSYNETYRVTTPFSGMKPYNDSPGGYSGSPLSVWQEGTWGMILMLLDLYPISGLASFFTSLGTTLDATLTTLIAGQASLLQATGNGSLLAYSLAARAIPYEFEVWPALAPTAWMWLVSTNPSLLLTVAGLPQLLPYMYVPTGAEQSIDDKNGSSSVGQMEIHCIDPGGVLHTLAAQEELIGQVATFSMGFPGSSIGDFVPLHVVQISEIGFDSDGRVILKAEDLKRFAQGAFLWANGGPEEYLPGQKNDWQPSGAQWLANGYPVSNDNPRWLSGNPLDIFLAAMQNELGVGQDLALSAVVEVGGTGELIAAVNPFWARYLPGNGNQQTGIAPVTGDPATLINPNSYLDVAGITALRDSMFSGDWFEFKITSPQQARSWLEDQILKPLGLVMVVTASGQLTLKAMKNPANQTPVMGFNQNQIVGIPEVRLAPVINALAYRLNADDSATNTSARTYNTTVTMLQQASYNLFRYLYNHQVEAAGLRTGRGGTLRAFLLGDQLFRRYGFATPVYQVVTQLGALQPELKDWISLTHPLVPDYVGGGRGVTNIPCEIIGRSPDYANGQVRFTLLDMRRASTTSPYEIVPSASMVLPPYAQATESEQETYFFITPSTNGVYTEALSTIF